MGQQWPKAVVAAARTRKTRQNWGVAPQVQVQTDLHTSHPHRLLRNTAVDSRVRNMSYRSVAVSKCPKGAFNESNLSKNT